jgi:hypothetical protein
MQEELREHGHFNFPKVHLLGHFRKSIERFGALLQHSTTTTEISHKGQIKRGFQRSNRTGDYYQQILRYNARREAFAIRKVHESSRAARRAGRASSATRDCYRKSAVQGWQRQHQNVCGFAWETLQ